MGSGRHQLEPVSQVAALSIVTGRVEPRVNIPRSCSGSARSCPFTSKPPPDPHPVPSHELGAKHDVITPIWLQTCHGTGKWSPVSSQPSTKLRLVLASASKMQFSRENSLMIKRQVVPLTAPPRMISGRYQWLHQMMGRGRSVTNPRCFVRDKHHLSPRVLLLLLLLAH